jgi:hypothetical protein
MTPMTNPPGEPDPHRPGPWSEQPTEPTAPVQQGPGRPTPAVHSAPIGYGSPPPGYPTYAAPPPTHGGGLAAMIVGIVSLVFICGYGLGLVGSPVAWWLGARALKEIDAAPGRYSGRGMAQAGFILGIIGTVLLALVILAVIVFLVVLVAVEAGSGPSTPAESF